MNWYKIHYFDGRDAVEKDVTAHSAADAIVCFERSAGGCRTVSYIECIEDPRIEAAQDAEYLRAQDDFNGGPRSIADMTPAQKAENDRRVREAETQLHAVDAGDVASVRRVLAKLPQGAALTGIRECSVTGVYVVDFIYKRQMCWQLKFGR